MPPRLASAVATRLAAALDAIFNVIRRLTATLLAPTCFARSGMNPKVIAHTLNWHKAFVNDGMRTSRREKMDRIDRVLTIPR